MFYYLKIPILTASALFKRRRYIFLSDSLPYTGLPPYLCCTVHRHDSALGCVLSCGPWCRQSSASFRTHDTAPSPRDGLCEHAAYPWWQRLLHISVETVAREQWQSWGGESMASPVAGFAKATRGYGERLPFKTAYLNFAPTCNKKPPPPPPPSALYHGNEFLGNHDIKYSDGSVGVSIQQYCQWEKIPHIWRASLSSGLAAHGYSNGLACGREGKMQVSHLILPLYFLHKTLPLTHSLPTFPSHSQTNLVEY